jgi:hypothetical protein
VRATALVAARPRLMRDDVLLAAALMTTIVLIGFVHAPAAPVIVGASIAYLWFSWRARR